ncbi:hypothetical protein HC928_00575 [bacterium]|nr:hypothetical protein [bacterium]
MTAATHDSGVPHIGGFHPRRINQYVPGMQFSSDVGYPSGITRISLGKPAAADPDGLIVNCTGVATTGTEITFTGATVSHGTLGAIASAQAAATGKAGQADATYGRRVVCSVAASGTAFAFDVEGYDYLSQPVKETVTKASNSTSAVSLKAFQEVTKITVGGTTAATTTDFGWHAVGMPYRTVAVLAEQIGGAGQTVGTLTAPVDTDPATATTGDPRGTYLHAGTLSTASEATLTIVCQPYLVAVSSPGERQNPYNGGLYGIKHYYA